MSDCAFKDFKELKIPDAFLYVKIKRRAFPAEELAGTPVGEPNFHLSVKDKDRIGEALYNGGNEILTSWLFFARGIRFRRVARRVAFPEL